MKKNYFIITLTLLLSVFTVCFLIGRAIAEKDNKGQDNKNESGIASIPHYEEEITPTGTESSGVKKEVAEVDSVFSKSAPLTVAESEVLERMSKPCNGEVIKEYSQTAVYSKTTDDWRSHLGIDYKAELNSDVTSICDGTVANIYNDRIWGNCIEIIHKGNILGIYRNLSDEINVSIDEKVSEGQAIAKVGNSASVERLEEAHLHLEIWIEGMPINPVSFIY